MAGRFKNGYKRNKGKFWGGVAGAASFGIAPTAMAIGAGRDAIKNKQYRKSLEEQLGEVARSAPKYELPKTGEYTDMARRAAEAPGNVKYRELPRYASAGDAAKYVKDMQAGLGVQAPQDIRDAQRKSVFDQLDRQAYETTSADVSNLASQGLSNSGAALALAGRRGSELQGQKLGAEAGLQEQYADAMDKYRSELLGLGMEQAGAMSRYGADATQQANEFGLRQAGMSSDALGRSAGMLSDDEFRRLGALYEANQLMPWQAEMGALAGELGRENERRGQNMAFAGNIIGAGMGVAGAAMGAPGAFGGGGQQPMPQAQAAQPMPAFSGRFSNSGLSVAGQQMPRYQQGLTTGAWGTTPTMPKYQQRIGFGSSLY